MVTISDTLAEVQFTQHFPSVPYLQDKDEKSDLCSLNLSIWFTLVNFGSFFGLNRTFMAMNSDLIQQIPDKSQCKHGTISSRGLAQSLGLLTFERCFLKLL